MASTIFSKLIWTSLSSLPLLDNTFRFQSSREILRPRPGPRDLCHFGTIAGLALGPASRLAYCACGTLVARCCRPCTASSSRLPFFCYVQDSCLLNSWEACNNNLQ